MVSRVLFTSPVQPFGGSSPNVYSWDKDPSPFRFGLYFINHPGLRFLKANTPCEILEYPTAESFHDALSNPPDILGISFYINETNIALRMAEVARSRGVKEVWAGNFGAYTPEAREYFDKVVLGWGEQQVSEALGLESNDYLVHPEIYNAAGFASLFLIAGALFTSRGCPWTCNFCQTPGFYGKASAIKIETIDRVIRAYSSHGIRGVNILDENFGTFRDHSRAVLDRLQANNMRWLALTRVDTLEKNLDDWISKGLFGVHLGIESLSQTSLDSGNKRLRESTTIGVLKELSSRNIFVQAFYIIGFEEDTPGSIRHDVELLASLDIDVVQVQVLTPYPRTGQREAIVNLHGLLRSDLSLYNSRNLVWRHPTISPEEMRRLQLWANRKLFSPKRAFRTLSKFGIYCGRERAGMSGLRLLASTLGVANRRLQRCLRPNLRGARQWSSIGWYPYEEVDWQG